MKFKHLLYLLISLTLVNCSKDDGELIPLTNTNSGTGTVEELSSENKILTFSITSNSNTFNGVINHTDKTITIETNSLETSTSISPQITISLNASISPSITASQNFNNNVSYTVTAENGDIATYTVTTNNTPISSEKKILTFQIEIGGNIIDGVIDHTNLVIELDTWGDITSVVPIVTISDYATISPDTNVSHNFTSVQIFTVTAQNGSSNNYSVYVSKPDIRQIDGGKYYAKAIIEVQTKYVDLTIPNSKMVLDNGNNSYDLVHSNYLTFNDNSGYVNFSNFSLYLTDNIITATNYKLKYVVDNQVRAESDFFVDVIGGSVPTITSANQSFYYYGDTMILSGSNLVAGLRIYAYNGSIYQYSTSNVSVDSTNTILTFPMNINSIMFPAYVGGQPYTTPVTIYSSGRKGQAINLEFR